MTTLPKAARKALEDATLAARHAAETAVAKRFSALDLTGSAAPAGIGDGDRAPRIALRRRAISLGQGRVEGTLRGTDAVRAGAPFLVEELAYESWHRLLFARFLAENGLLVHPAFGVALSVADVAGLAAEQGADPWQLAASFAAHRLPGLFHLTTPLSLAAEDRQDLAAILAGMDPALFTASDALGWTYQFWQAKRKDEVNASGAKIDGATLPPVTQLFTEDYIVDFLLQNSLGAWYVARHPETRLAERWPYLRYREDGTPAAGTFPTWPDAVREVTLLDPCCGSGHFLVAAFQLLTAMRQEAEGLAPAEAADAVLRDNLFGLELDPRCTQIATFAVALEAWKLGGHPERHLPHIACSGLPVAGQRASWEALAGGDANLRLALGQLHELFAQAGELGSLIDPQRALLMGDKAKPGHLGFVLPHEWPAVEQRLERALAREQRADPAARVFDSSDHDLLGTIRAARLLGRTYTLVATNVPYLSRGSQGETLKRFADLTSPEAKGDLATLFLERCLRFVAASDDERGTPRGAGTVAAVTPQNWLFLGAYKKLRQALLEQHSLNALMRLGEHGFSSSQAAGAFTALAILTAAPPSLDHAFAGIDAAAAPDPEAKAARLRTGDLTLVAQARQRRNPDQRIVLGDLASGPLLCEFADSYDGLRTGDLSQFSRMIWEKGDWDDEWQFFQSTVEGRASFSGREQFLKWEHNKGKLRERASAGLAYIKGGNAWGKCGIVVSQMRELPVAIYTGNFYDHNVSPIIPKDPAHLPAIWAFCSSPDYHEAVRKIDSALKVTNASLVKVPFDLARWQRVAEERYPDGLPAPHSSDPTQWLFDGLVLAADHPLQVAMARLLGYRWPEQADDGLDPLADPDGIVCLPSVYREPPADDRLRALLAAAYGEGWSDARLGGLLRDVGAPSLAAWLRAKSGFFAQHVKLFHHRPFLWHLTDGQRDGFAAIVNDHRFDGTALSKLIYTYLGDWIGRQERAAAAGEAGAQGRLDAATTLRQKLIAIAAGEPPYDVYVRWKPLAEQPIGWEPDLNDGVRLNIRPFVAAGVLATKVNVKWGKDRGADPTSHEEPLRREASGDLKERLDRHCATERHNDLHFSRAEKERARHLAAAATTPGGMA